MAPVSDPVPRQDAVEKASGVAVYLADIRVPGMLYARSVRSSRARAVIRSVHYPAMPEGYRVIDARDITERGHNAVLMIKDDWPIFADHEVRFRGQTIALIVGPDRDVLVRLRDAVRVDYEERQPVLTIEESRDVKGGPLHGRDNLFADYTVQRGDPDGAFARAHHVVTEELNTGFQEHIYMETQGSLASWHDGRITLQASMQCPYYLKKALVHALGCRKEDVRVQQPCVGGGFGGKEHYPDVLATAAAIATRAIGKPVQIVLDRQEDIQNTPKRHPARITFRTALDERGQIIGMHVDTLLNAGAYETCSAVVLQRAVFACTGAYDIPNLRVRGRACATNIVPTDAFRGFGAPQAIFAIEMHMDHLARRAGVESVEFRRRYLQKKGSITVTGGTIHDDVLLPGMIDAIVRQSGYAAKRVARGTGRGIGISIFNHGCAFTGNGERSLIKARVALRKHADGDVLILAAGVDMGQGLATTFRKIVAAALGIPLSRVTYGSPDTDLVPDSGPTCASRSIMIVGYLLQEAARKLKAEWQDGQAHEVWQDYVHPEHLQWDQENLHGDAYPTWGWGVNAVEVSVDPLTFEVRTEKVWTVYDVGYAIDTRVVEGQAHGGMSQALGYAGLERLEMRDGAFLQSTMADYTIPTSLDFPATETNLVENPYPFGPFGAKGAGELVFDGGAPAFALAVQQAIGADVHAIPLTPEAIMKLTRAPENGA